MFGSFLQVQSLHTNFPTLSLCCRHLLSQNLRSGNNGSGLCRHEAVVLYGFTNAHMVYHPFVHAEERAVNV